MRFVFIDRDGREVAIESAAAARAAVDEGRLDGDTMVRTEPGGAWRLAREALRVEDIYDAAEIRAARFLKPRRYRGPGRIGQGPRAALRTIGIVFLLIGLAGFVIAGAVALWQWQRLAGMVATEGTVVELVGPSVSVRPVIEYAAQDGRTYQHVGFVKSALPLFAPGDRVTVYYRPDDPEDAMLGYWTAWFLAILPAGMGTIFFAIGAGLYLASRAGRAALPPSGAPPSAVERRR